MTDLVLTHSRRKFIQQMTQGLALAGAGLMLPSAFATNTAQLAYRIGKPELLLHFNENSLGMSPKAMLAAQQAVAKYGNRYPDDSVNQLKQRLANIHKVSDRQIILGNGSTEVIGAIVTYAAKQNATVVEPTPTFGDVRRRAASHGLSIKKVEVGTDFVTDIAALKKQAESIQGAKLINICNPNNPTGSIVDQSALRHWIETASPEYLFLIDEAYFEYAQQNKDYVSILPLIRQGKENIVLTRTFSKIYGMAGMRIGYGIAAPETASKIDNFATSFNLSAAGVAAAMASLEDKDFFQQSLASNQMAKDILTNTLNKLELPFIQSNTNFVLHRINSDLANYSRRMKQNSVRVGRRMTKDDGWNRLSIGQPDEMRVFSEILLAFREKGWV